MDPKRIEFPCTNKEPLTSKRFGDPRKTSLQDCERCNKRHGCDIYATMLDEVYDME